MTYTDVITLKASSGELYSFTSLDELFNEIHANNRNDIIYNLGDKNFEYYFDYGRREYVRGCSLYVVLDIYNLPISSAFIQKLYSNFLKTKRKKRFRNSNPDFIPVYRRGPIEWVRKYSASGFRLFRSFRYINEKRQLIDLKYDEDAKQYNCFPRGKRMNHPHSWDDYKCERSKSWKNYRKTQYKQK